MQVFPVMAVNYNSNNFKRPSFEGAVIDKSFERFIELQVKNSLDYIKSQHRGALTKKQIKYHAANLRYGWYQAYNALQNKAKQMSDDVVISVKQTHGSIYSAPVFNTLSAKNTKTGKSKDLVMLVELSGQKSHYIGADKFKECVGNLDISRINESLKKKAHEQHIPHDSFNGSRFYCNRLW